MLNKKFLMLMSIVLIFALVFVGCNGDDESSGSSKDTLVVGQGADAKTLDPHATNDQPSSRVAKQIYDTLVNQNESMELEPGLAESWEAIDDLTFEFKLREGVKFHNGEELKASDVKFTLLRALESSQIGHIVGAIDGEKLKLLMITPSVFLQKIHLHL